MKFLISLAILGLLATDGVVRGDENYPLREKFPGLKYVTVEEFQAMDDVIIVDARSVIEYDVIHISGCHNLDVEKIKREDLLALRAIDGKRPIVFYCNGVTCHKSYQAGEKARIWGFQNTFVFDAGIFAWVKAQPTRAEFWGKPLDAEQVKSKLFTKEQLDQVSLPPAEFIAAARGGDWLVFDVRGTSEREKFQIELPGRRRCSMEDFVGFLRKGIFDGKKVLALDTVGREISWLHYYLAGSKVADFRFLKGGAEQWQKDGFDNDGNR